MSNMLGYWYRLYTQMTPAEQALEPAIAALGERYRAQHPFLKYKHFADFALLDRNLIIEVDGDSHDKPAQIKKDLERMLALRSDGWVVARLRNEAAMSNPTAAVEAALAYAKSPQTVAELEAALARHQRNYPELFVAPAKPSKSTKSRRPTKARAARKPAGVRHKQLASGSPAA